MKKFSIFLAVFFLIGTLSVPANAVEASPDVVIINNTETHNAVMEITIQAFPEYETKIRGEHLTSDTAAPASASNSTPKLLVNETRNISETMLVSYKEYDNGIVLTSIATTAGKNITSTHTGTGYKSTIMNIWLNVAGSTQVLNVNNVQFTYLQNSYGTIPDPGTVVESSSSPHHILRKIYVSQGSANTPATLEYQAGFDIYFTSTDGDVIVTSQLASITLKVYANSMDLSSRLG